MDEKRLTPRQPAERVRLAAIAASQFGVEALLVVLQSASEGNGNEMEAIQILESRRDWTPEEVEEYIKTLLGRCDICFRSSYCSDPTVDRKRLHSRELYTWNPLVVEAKTGKQTDELDLADINTGDPFNDVLFDQSSLAQYRERCITEKGLRRVREAFCDAFKIRTALINVVVKNRLFCQTDTKTGELQHAYTVSNAIKFLRDNLKVESHTLSKNVRTRFTALMLKCYTLMQKAKLELKSMEFDVGVHVRARVQRGGTYLSYDFLGGDVIVRIAEHSGWRNCATLLKVASDFSVDTQLKRMLPHLSVRRVPGLYPHSVEYIPGIGLCDVVCKNTLVHVVVDLCITGAKRESCKFAAALMHKDESAGFDDDQFGETRDTRRLKKVDIIQRRFRNFPCLDLPGYFRARISALCFFLSEVECSVSLVYADNHNDVPSDGPCCVLRTPHSMEKYKDRLTTYTARDGVPYPACSSFNVLHLSSQDKRLLYKFKVVGKASYCVDGNTVHKTLESFSEPFVVVSSKRTLKRRRTKEQVTR